MLDYCKLSTSSEKLHDLSASSSRKNPSALDKESGTLFVTLQLGSNWIAFAYETLGFPAVYRLM